LDYQAAGLEILHRGDSHSFGFPEDSISELRYILWRDSQAKGFSKDWISRLQEILWRIFAGLGISWEEA